MAVLHGLLSFVQVVIAVAGIYIVAIQQSKTEGLGGSVGPQTQASYKGMPGFEERLSGMTRYMVIAFFVVSILVAVTANR